MCTSTTHSRAHSRSMNTNTHTNAHPARSVCALTLRTHTNVCMTHRRHSIECINTHTHTHTWNIASISHAVRLRVHQQQAHDGDGYARSALNVRARPSARHAFARVAALRIVAIASRACFPARAVRGGAHVSRHSTELSVWYITTCGTVVLLSVRDGVRVSLRFVCVLVLFGPVHTT